MRIVYIAAGQTPEVRDIGGSLEDMKKLVGGYIETIHPFNDTAVIVCNEEGKINGLPLNRSLLHPETGELYEIIAGNFFICDAPPDSDELKGLSEEQVKTYMELFEFPEIFMKEHGKIIVVKCTSV